VGAIETQHVPTVGVHGHLHTLVFVQEFVERSREK
jgi:hypothetical protein